MSYEKEKTTVDQNIISRRTIKSFKEDPIDPEEIIELLNIAKWAPNHKLTQPWRFQLYTDKGKGSICSRLILIHSPQLKGKFPKRYYEKHNITKTYLSNLLLLCLKILAKEHGMKITVLFLRLFKTSNLQLGIEASE